jgi:hypothetical protein
MRDGDGLATPEVNVMTLGNQRWPYGIHLNSTKRGS